MTKQVRMNPNGVRVVFLLAICPFYGLLTHNLALLQWPCAHISIIGFTLKPNQ